MFCNIIASLKQVLILGGVLIALIADALVYADDATGLHVGGFTVFPSLEVGGEYISNVYRQENNSLGDYLARVRPKVAVESGWGRHSLGLIASADIANYGNYATEDYQNFTTNLHGRLDVLRNSYAVFSGGANRQIQLRGSADDRFGNTPTVYYDYFGKFDYFHRFNRLSVNVGHYVDYYSFNNVAAAGGSNAVNLNISPRTNAFEEAYYLHNTDRNHTVNAAHLRLGYLLRNGYEAFVRGSYLFKDYDQQKDDFGYARSSKGYRVDAGMSFDLTALLKGNVFVSYMDLHYDDPRLGDTRGMGGGVELKWLPTRLTTVSGIFASNINETQLAGVSGYYGRTFTLEVDHELRRNVLLSARAGYGNNAYNGLQLDINGNSSGFPQRNENYYMFGATVKYMINRHFYARAYYDYFNREVNVVTDNYDWHRIGIAVGANY
jgi:hypothetical protein